MEQFTQDPQALFDYDVVADGDKIGSVDNVWVDDATNAPEFVGVKTGWLLGHSHIVPLADAQVSDHTINVPYSQDQIKNAPSYSGDQDLSPDQEQQIYDYYGLQRSTQATPSGYGTDQGTGTQTGVAGQADETSGQYTGQEPTVQDQYADQTLVGSDNTVQDVTGSAANQTQYVETGTAGSNVTEQNVSGQQTVDVPLVEEQLQVGTRQVTGTEQGQLRLRKIVRTEREEVPVELRRERVTIDRVAADDVQGVQVPDNAFQDETITIPLMEETPVVQKEGTVSEVIRVSRTPEVVTETVEADVRREEIEVDTSSLPDDVQVRNSAGDVVQGLPTEDTDTTTTSS